MNRCILCNNPLKDICDECHDDIFRNYKSAKDWDKEKKFNCGNPKCQYCNKKEIEK